MTPPPPRLRFFPLAAVFALFGTYAQAEELPRPGQTAQLPPSAPSHGPDKKDGWNFSLGLATLYSPSFLGSKDYQLMVVPDIKVEYGDRFFASLFEGIGYNLVNSDGWRAGPIMKLGFGRQEDDSNPFRVAGKKSNALKGLGDVDNTIELGGFVEYSYEPFTASLELRQGVGGHNGLIGEASLNYTGSLGPIFFGLGPHATFGDKTYNNAFFGINSVQSSRSGLTRYSADLGLVSYGVGIFAATHVSDSVTLGVMGGYDRLGSEAADSPLIKQRGQKDQLSVGLRLSYEFGN